MKYFAIIMICVMVGFAMSLPQYGRDPGTAPVGNTEYVGPGQLGGSSGGRDPGRHPVGSVGGRDPGRPPVGNVDPNYQGYGVGNPNVYGRPGRL